jgi:hypothetical protein
MKTSKFYEADGNSGGIIPESIDDTAAIDKLLETNSEPEQAPVQPDKAETETPEVTSEVVTPQEQPQKTVTPETTPETAPDKGQAVPDKVQPTITREYIDSLGLSSEDEKYALKFIDKPISEFFKSYANAQKLIGKKKEELLTKPQAAPQVPQTVEQVQKAKEELILTELRRKVPALKDNLPPTLDTSSEEYKDWARDLNYDDPDTYSEFRQARNEISAEIEQTYQNLNQLRSNYDKINADIIHNEIDTIESDLRAIGASSKELGYDFTIAPDGSNALLDDLLIDSATGEIDNKLVTYVNGEVPIINTDAVRMKFFKLNLPQITKKIAEKARLEAVKTMQGQVKEVPASLSGSQISGKTKKELTAADIEGITDPDKIDELLLASGI